MPWYPSQGVICTYLREPTLPSLIVGGLNNRGGLEVHLTSVIWGRGGNKLKWVDICLNCGVSNRFGEGVMVTVISLIAKVKQTNRVE